MVYANIQLLDKAVQQCIAYTFPTMPGTEASSLVRSASQPLSFRGVGKAQGEDCRIYSAPLTRGRTVLVWVSEEEIDHHGIVKVEVQDETSILRTIDVVRW